jgi:histone acetyltransferase HTATIP
MNTLKHLGMLKFGVITQSSLDANDHQQGKHYIVLTDPVIDQHTKQQARRKRVLKPDALVWTPPVFTANQLRFGF